MGSLSSVVLYNKEYFRRCAHQQLLMDRNVYTQVFSFFFTMFSKYFSVQVLDQSTL